MTKNNIHNSQAQIEKLEQEYTDVYWHWTNEKALHKETKRLLHNAKCKIKRLELIIKRSSEE